MTQPEALRLADELEETILAVANGILKPANLLIEPICRSFAELRRLHEVNQELVDALESILGSKPFVGMNPSATVGSPYAVEWNVHTIARAALAKARRTE